MKRFFLSGLLVLALIATSCERFLDVRQPDIIPYNNALTRIENVEALTRAMYNDFQGMDQFILAYTFLGDEVNLDRQLGSDYVTGVFGNFNGTGENLWGTGYRAIHKANQLIASSESQEYPATEPVRNRIMGEAYFIRGYMHFELCRAFALPYSAGANRPGIVIRTRAAAFAEDELNNKLGRSSVGESYQQAISDLRRALELLPESPASGRFGKDAARAALARVYFNMDVQGNGSNYQEAVNYATQLITSGKYAMTNPISPFRSTGIGAADRGVIFQLVNTLSDATGGALSGNFWADTSINVPSPLLTGLGGVFEVIQRNGGIRFDTLTKGKQTDRPFSLKYIGNAQPFFNLPIFRYSEVLLNRAEANLLINGDVNQSLADVNAVRTAAGLSALSTTNPTVLLDSIRIERHVELVLEGDRYHQLRRLRLPIRGNAYDNSTKFFQIPISESRANPAIELN